MKLRNISLTALALSLSLTLSSQACKCGCAHDHKDTGKTVETADNAEDKKADVSITIEGNDTMQFDKKAFEVTEGQVVEITFKNVGKLPKEAMGHNLVILKPGTAGPAFAMAGVTNKETYLPTDEDNAGKIVAATKILGPGEEEKITFTAGEAGEYPFICTFPGHFGVMNGVMTVKAK